jgi:hypothetical protein
MRTVITDTERAIQYGTTAGRIQVELEKFEPWERGHILLSMLLSMTVKEHMDQAERHEKIDYLAAMMKEHADAAFLLGESEASGTH